MIIYKAKLIKITENINKTGRFLEDNLYYFGGIVFSLMC